MKSKSRRTRPSPPKASEIRKLLSDQPISDEADDRLDRLPFVEKLEALITSAVPPHSLVMALSGAWGEGKSSILCLTAGRLSRTDGHVVVWFDPWHYESLTELVDALLAKVGAAEVGTGKLMKAARNAREALRQRTISNTTGLSAFVVSTQAQEVHDLPPSLADGFELISRALLDSGRRLVLLCEDLDRLSHEQARRFFSLLFSLRKVDNLTVLLPMDRVELTKILGQDAHLLDRLIEVDIPLPGIETVLVQTFVLEELGKVFDAHGIRLDTAQAERMQQSYVRALHLALTNLRKAKQWLNAVDIGLRLVGKEVDPVDFAVLQAIRIFFPEAHRKLEFQPALFVGGFSLQLVGTPDAQQAALRTSAVAEYLAAADPPGRPALEELSEVLIPGFYHLSQGAKPSQSFEILQTRRFAHPDNFPKYFLFRPEQKDVPFEDVDALAAALEQDDAAAEGVFAGFWERHGKRGPYVFDRLLQRAQGLSPQAAARLITQIGRFSDQFGRESGDLQPSQADRARATVFQAGNRAPDPRSAFVELISSTPSLDFGAELLFFLRNRDRNLIFERWDAINVDELSRSLANRVEASPIEAVAKAEVPGSVLQEVGKETATAFVARALASGTDVEIVLNWFRYTRTDESDLSYERLDRTLHAEVLVEPARTRKGRRTAEFLEWWESRSEVANGDVSDPALSDSEEDR